MPKGPQKCVEIDKKGVLITAPLSNGVPGAPRGSQGALSMDSAFIFDGFGGNFGMFFQGLQVHVCKLLGRHSLTSVLKVSRHFANFAKVFWPVGSITF